MSLPILIIGGSQQSRNKKAQDLTTGYSSTFDTTLLNTKEAFGISEVRNLISKLARRPYESSHQTLIITEAQNLTIEAQNALLKTLEESPESANIILTAPTAEGLVSTVSSRCQKIELSPSEETTSQDQFNNFLPASYYQRFQTASKLDIDTWLAFWRQILLSGFGTANTPFIPEKGELRKIVNYVKLLSKAQILQKKYAAPKLLKTLLLLEAPLASLRKVGSSQD